MKLLAFFSAVFAVAGVAAAAPAAPDSVQSAPLCSVTCPARFRTCMKVGLLLPLVGILANI
mgnify:CR=1 FL=1